MARRSGTTSSRVARLLLPAVVVAAGCAEEEPGGAADPVGALGACPETEGEIDFAGAEGFLGHTAEWLQVDVSASARSRSIDDAPRDSTSDLSLPVRPVGPDGEASAQAAEPRTLRLHGSLLESIDWATRNPGSEVYLGVGDADHSGQVLFAVAIDRDDQFAFAGRCASRSLTSPIDDDLRSTDHDIHDLIGTTGEAMELVLVSPPDPVDSDPPVVLHPGDADDELLNSLRPVGVEIHVPESWAAPATLCTRVDEGWNDCLPLDGSLPFPRSMSVFVGRTQVLELWLVDQDGDLDEPLQRLGAVQVPSDVLEGRAPLVVRLEGSLNAEGTAVEGPAVSLVGAA